MIKLIIFDYDGVIVDSFPMVHEVYQKVCEHLGKNCPKDIVQFQKIYGNSSIDCYNALGFSDEDKQICGLMYKEEILKKKPKLFDGMKDVLKELHKDYELVLISATYKEEVEQKLKQFGINHYFDIVLARIHHTERLSKVEYIKNVLHDKKMTPDEVLMIGDRNVDFWDGSNAGLTNILLVDYGWGYDLKQIPEYKVGFHIKKPSDILLAVKNFK